MLKFLCQTIFSILIANSVYAIKAIANDAIFLSREQLKKRNRLEAAEILIQEIRKDKNSQKSKELASELDKVSYLFFSNDGQKFYELAESMRFAGQECAIEKHEEALKVEPTNLKIQIALATLYHTKNKCDRSKELINAGLKINPYNLDLKILYLQNILCSKKKMTLEDEAIVADVKNNLNIKIIYAEMFIEQDKNEEALLLLRDIEKIDKNLPYTYFLQWKISKNDLGQGKIEAQTYLNLCKSNNHTLKRKYYFIPNICADIDMVEDYLRKTEVST